MPRAQNTSVAGADTVRAGDLDRSLRHALATWLTAACARSLVSGAPAEADHAEGAEVVPASPNQAGASAANASCKQPRALP